MMTGIVINDMSKEKVEYLDNLLLDKYNHIKLLPAAFYHNLPKYHLFAWCTYNARYVIPTVELIYWLKKQINGRKAIEIGAGNGDLGYHLGIHMTDNYSQQLPEVLLWYQLHNQQPTRPGCNVEQLEAVEAVIKYRPDVVIGAYITQRATEDTKPQDSGNVYGPEEADLLWRVPCYIHMGNDRSHGDKRIRKYTHAVYRPSWLVTRSAHPEENSIFVWGK